MITLVSKKAVILRDILLEGLTRKYSGFNARAEWNRVLVTVQKEDDVELTIGDIRESLDKYYGIKYRIVNHRGTIIIILTGEAQ